MGSVNADSVNRSVLAVIGVCWVGYVHVVLGNVHCARSAHHNGHVGWLLGVVCDVDAVEAGEGVVAGLHHVSVVNGCWRNGRFTGAVVDYWKSNSVVVICMLAG